eukprot:702912-Rhodomonas_salina.1
MGRRNLMNALLTGSIAGPILVLPAVLISFLTPAKSGGGGGGENTLCALGKRSSSCLLCMGEGTDRQRSLAVHLTGC